MRKIIFGLFALFLVLSARLLPAGGSREPGRNTWREIDGTIFGCLPDETGPIGGGKGYSRTVTGGDYRAETLDQLLEALRLARPGETVFVPARTELDFTGLVYAEDFVLHVPGGVTLASSRGTPGSSGALLKSDAFQTSPLIQADGPGVRITGLRIRGPDPERRLEHWERSFDEPYEGQRGELTKRQYFYRLPTANGIVTESDDLEVDNCELSGWSHAAVFLKAGQGHRVHHNYIHGNQRQGLGYGVSHGTAFSLIEYNQFDWNRHSIAATGQPPSGYVARHNVELGHSLSHNFDVHGGRDRGDGTQTAGSRIEIYNNTFLGSDRAIGIRGRPEEFARIHGNWFAWHHGPGAAVIIDWPPADTVELGRNLYGTGAPSVQ